ncbi:unnamed protein product [Ectocarpus sp. CCAP 1310/34]|nr:unnamed protein product [Ectocarpus sp. CCAP 1310/34]
MAMEAMAMPGFQVLAPQSNGGDQGPVKDEENRKRGVDAQGEEDGGGGSALDEGGGREGESLGGQPPDGGKVVGPKTGSKKKRLDSPSPQISIPLQMVALAEKHHEEQRKGFEQSRLELDG